MFKYISYETIRFTILLILLFVYNFIVNKIKASEKIKKIILSVLAISTFFLIYIPYEKDTLKFKSLSDCIDYYEGTTVGKVKISDNKYITVQRGNRSKYNSSYFYKDKNYWKHGGVLERTEFGNINIYTIRTNDNSLILFIYTENKNIDIKDNAESEFKKEKYYRSNKEITYIYKEIKKIKENYYLIINNEKIEL